MSTDIFQTKHVLATVFAGPEREDGGRRTMIQISDQSGMYVQLYPSVLQGILTAWYEHNEQKNTHEGGEPYIVVASYQLAGATLEARRVVRLTPCVIFVLVTETAHLKYEEEIDAKTANVLICMQRAEDAAPR